MMLQAHRHRYVGGKQDDITVVIAYVSEPAESDSVGSSGSDDEASSGKSGHAPTLSKM